MELINNIACKIKWKYSFNKFKVSLETCIFDFIFIKNFDSGYK